MTPVAAWIDPHPFPSLDVDRRILGEAGIDSLSAFELRLRIEQQLRLEVPLARYARASRFDDLAALSRALVEEARAREQ